MKKLVAIGAALALSGCGNMPHIDACKYASVRRATYTAAINAADLLIASGRPVPAEVQLGRTAAATALMVLNRNCPVVTNETVSLP